MLPQRIAEIQTGWLVVRAQPTDSAALAILTMAVHSLAGSAGSFGYARLGEQARHIELEIESRLGADAGEPARATNLGALETKIASLVALATAGPDNDI
jgi:periplasmic divalent cation tolerance protein